MTVKYDPTLIITVGKGYNYYKEAFGYMDIEHNDNFKIIAQLLNEGSGEVKAIMDINNHRLFINIPFLGRPLNSHKLMIEVGEEIKSLISKYNISLEKQTIV